MGLINTTTSEHRREQFRQAKVRERNRRKGNIELLKIELPHAAIDLLIDLGWLGEAESADRVEVGKAIVALITDAARNHNHD
jgi:hypothetical protein